MLNFPITTESELTISRMYQESAVSDQLIIRGNHCLLYFDRILEGYTNFAHKSTILDPLETVTAGLCREIIPRGLPVLSEHSDEVVQRLLVGIVNRVTGRSGDETICIASYLGLDAIPLLKASLADRMPLLLEMLPNILANVLFCLGPRIFEKGFRWAPRIFLASTNVMRGSRLLPLIQTRDEVKRPMAYLHPDQKGLMIMLPAIRLPGLHLSNLRRAHHAYFGLGNGKIRHINVVAQLERARSCEPAAQDLTILLPYRDQVVTKDAVDQERFAVLIQSVNENLEPTSYRQGIGMLKPANYLGYLQLVHFDEDTLRLNETPITAELIQPRWWLIDGEPYQAPVAFPDDGLGTFED